ncbi:MAG: DUF3047 domain-containing protein [Balneolales bacterium]|nr:DUF3047 domain-containing protein [Balneolales bacterium]
MNTVTTLLLLMLLLSPPGVTGRSGETRELDSIRLIDEPRVFDEFNQSSEGESNWQSASLPYSGMGATPRSAEQPPSSDVLHVGTFSTYDPAESTLPENWKPMTFRGINHTEYQLVTIDDRTAVKAFADNASSGLIHRKNIDLEEFPIIEWSWRVENILEGGDVTRKSGDDYPARIYVIFDYDLSNLSWGQRNMIRALRTFYGDVPARAINYIYTNSSEIGTIVKNPYTDLVTMVVVDSGEDHFGEWRSFSRNIYDDYIQIYNEPPPPVAAIAIMTDSDDTGEKATAYFGDILFRKK